MHTLATRRPAPLPTRFTNRLNPGNNGGERDVPPPVKIAAIRGGEALIRPGKDDDVLPAVDNDVDIVSTRRTPAECFACQAGALSRRRPAFVM